MLLLLMRMSEYVEASLLGALVRDLQTSHPPDFENRSSRRFSVVLPKRPCA